MTFDVSLFDLLLAFTGGFVSFLSPCVLPLVPGWAAWACSTGRGDWAGVPLLSAYALYSGMLVFLIAFYFPQAAAALRRFSHVGRTLQVASGVVMPTIGVLMMTGETSAVAGWMVNAFPFLARLG